MTGFKDLPRPKDATPAAAPLGSGAPDAGEHPLLAHAPAALRPRLSQVIAAGKPYPDMTDEEKQAEAKRLIAAEDAELARGEQLGLS